MSEQWLASERQVVITDHAGNLIRHMKRAVISDVERRDDGTVTCTIREVSTEPVTAAFYYDGNTYPQELLDL